MTRFEESSYRFVFNEDWELIKYDAHRFYRSLSGQDLSGVDFAGIYKNEYVYLFEIKNFKQYNKKRAPIKSIDDYTHELEEKAKDSLVLIRVIYKYMQRKWLYRLLIPLLRKLPSLHKEWYFWTRLYELSVVDQKVKFVLLQNAEFDLEDVLSQLTKSLGDKYEEVICADLKYNVRIDGLQIEENNK